MSCKNTVKRRKAFIGAAIGAAANIIGSIISNKKKQKAEEAQYRQQQAEQVRTEGVQQAAAVTQNLNNTEYADEYKKRITLKNGGKVYTDRLKRNKVYACGGRKKAILGLGDAMSGIGNLATAILTKPSVPKQIVKSDGFNIDTNNGLATKSYQVDANGNPVIQARFGTKKKCKKC
nr:MAG TPA: hypothetical protein [Crassvirales sp.]